MLNVTLREDDCLIRDSTAVHNFALLRKIAINLVARDCSTKASLQGKREKAAWNDGYMQQPLKINFHALYHFFIGFIKI